MARVKVPKWLRVLIPSVLILTWLAGATLGGPYFGRVGEVADVDLVAFLPSSAESTKVNEIAKDFQDSSVLPAVVVFESKDDQALGEGTIEELSKLAGSLSQLIPEIEGEVAPPIQADDKRAAFLVVPIDSDAKPRQVIEDIKSEVGDSLSAETNYLVGGPASFSSDLNKAFAGIDGLLLGVALSVVLVILLLVYRSPLLPFLVLMTSVFALAVSILLVWNLANADVIKLNGQVQGILFILVIGAATDYSLLYVARYREELYRQKDRLQATIASLKGSIEPITASGGTVIAGLLCLLASDLASNQALGPVGAIGIVFAMLSALTFLPSLLYVAGRRVFWPRVPKASPTELRKHQADLKKGIWTKIGNFVSRKPRLIWTSIVALMLVMSLGLLDIKADGVAQSDLVIGYSEAREAQAMLNRHFPDGAGSPVVVIAPEANSQAVVTALDKDRGIDGVTMAADVSDSGTMPVGKAEEEIRQAISEKIGNQAPNADMIAEMAYPFQDAKPTVVDGQVRLQATLVDSPDSPAAQDTVERLRTEVKAIDETVLVGGQTAIQLDTDKASINDRAIIIPMVLVAITIILMLLLRSVVAPLLLLATTVLSFGAALGFSSLLFNHLWDFPGADPAVVLYSFIFLVALGIDYNIFLMTRVREEVVSVGTKTGVIKGLVLTGGVITSAGVVLAATFAALSVIPILFLVQLAFIVAFGVLLDTIVVRSLMVPALIRDLGSVVWWPSKLRHKK